MCSMKYVWSWSHASWATDHKTSLKKLLAVCPKGLTRKRKRINGNSNYKECQLESFLHYLQMQNMKITQGGELLQVKAIHLHWCFSRFLNRTNGTKSGTAFHIPILYFSVNFFPFQLQGTFLKWSEIADINGDMTWNIYQHTKNSQSYNKSTKIISYQLCWYVQN